MKPLSFETPGRAPAQGQKREFLRAIQIADILKEPQVLITQPEIEYSSFTLADVPSGREPFRLMNRVPIVDCGEPLVDLRETNRELSFGEYCLPYVRESVAKALKAATERVPEHLDLRVFTALRTLDQQAEMYWGNYRRAREEHPEWSEATLRKMTNRFFAPPDAKAPPGHCTGGAVDVGLLSRETGEGLDMSSPLKGWKGAPTLARGLSPETASNRRLLGYIMHSTGLSNCRDEFWHWSYGDSAWAVRVGASIACYGLIESPGHARRVGARVVLEPYDPEWPVQFELIREALREAIGPLAVGIEHVGSTSVPGLRAKPILDIDIEVADPSTMTAVIAALSEFGYEHQGDLGIAGREAFRVKRDGDSPGRDWHRHNLYACVTDCPELRRHTVLRDHLRANSSAATAYSELKQQLAALHPWDVELYADKKGPFIVAILREVDHGLLTDREATSDGRRFPN